MNDLEANATVHSWLSTHLKELCTTPNFGCVTLKIDGLGIVKKPYLLLSNHSFLDVSKCFLLLWALGKGHIPFGELQNGHKQGGEINPKVTPHIIQEAQKAFELGLVIWAMNLFKHCDSHV